MDKRQKELTSSYFRARKIAAQDSQNKGYVSYEINEYTVLNDLIKIKDIDVNLTKNIYALRKIFYKHPVKIFNKMDYDKFSYAIGIDSSLYPEIKNNPEILQQLDLDKIKGWDYARMIIKIPNIIEYLELNKLNGQQIAKIIEQRPELIEHFDLNLLEGDDVATVIINQPQLIKYLKNKLNLLDDMMIMHLLYKHPELKKYKKYFNPEYYPE